MAAIDFPSSPNDGDSFFANGIYYVYDATKGVWKVFETGSNFTLNDAQTLDGELPSYYLNYNNLNNKPDLSTYATEAFVNESLNTSNVTEGSNLFYTNARVYANVIELNYATETYVDEVAQGLLAKPSVEIATTASLDATYDNGVNGVGGNLTSNTNGAFPEIDGITLTSTTPGSNGVLVKDQTNQAHNGRYNLTVVGDAGTPWVLTRCYLCDESNEIPGAYTFVTSGNLYAGTGWVQTVDDPTTFVMGTDDILIVQFSGAGVFTAGDGLNLDATEFSVDNTVVRTTDIGTIASQDSDDVSITGGNITGLTSLTTSVATITSGNITGLSNLTSNLATFTTGRANTVVFDSEYDNGSSGSSITIDFNNGQKQKVTLTANCTFTFTSPTGPGNFLLKIINGGDVASDPTWPASVKWAGGTEPGLTITSGNVDIVTFYYDGTNYYGVASLDFV